MRFSWFVCAAVVIAIVLTACTLTPQQAADTQFAAAAATQASADLHAVQGALPSSDPTGKAAGKTASVVDEAVPILTSAADAAQSSGDVIGAALKAASPLSPYVALASIGWGILQTFGKRKANAAATSMQSGISAAIGNGSITVTPAVVSTVDAHVIDHPAADALVDTLAAAVAAKD